MASEVEGDKEPRELILGALHNVDQLTTLVDSSFQVPAGDQTKPAADTHNDSVTEDAPDATNQEREAELASVRSVEDVVRIPSKPLLEVTARLNSQLNQLMVSARPFLFLLTVL